MFHQRGRFSSAVNIAAIAAALSIAFSSVAQAAWTFDYRKTITIDSSKVTANLTDFPVLISLSGDMDLRTVGDGGHVQNANGYDILFRASDNTKLDFEIEEYSSTVGGATLIAWVRIPSLSSSIDTDVYLYYGNASISSSLENVTGVWDGNYKGVWHLKESGTGAANEFIDSSGNDNHGQGGAGVPGDVPTQVAAKIGNGQDFDNSCPGPTYTSCSEFHILIPNSATLQDVQEGAYTLEAWFHPDTNPPNNVPNNDQIYGIVLKRGEHSGITFEPNLFTLHHWLSGSDLKWNGAAGGSAPGADYHVVGTVDNAAGESNIYVNGVGSTFNWTPGAPREYGTEPWRIGMAGFIGNDWLWAADGQIDEVRISDKVRTPEWIQTGYNNQNNPTKNVACDDGGFSCIGAEAAGPWAIPMGHAYRKKLTIDSNRVTADLSNFPVLVSLTNDMDLRTTADGGDVRNANGYDINFRASDGTMLDFEIEEYASAVGGATLVAWVRVPNLSSSVDTDIYIYYGNPDVACSQESPAGVWDSNYQAVWHLNETPSGAGDIKDSTGTHDGTSTNMEAGDQTTGQIDGSLAFDGVNENVSIPDHGDWTFSGGEKRTYEGWFNFNVLPSTGDWDAIVEGPAGEYAVQFGEFGGSLRLVWYDNLSGDHYSPPISILAGEWHQYVLTLDLGVVNGSHWYLDGVDQGAFTAPNTTLNPNGLRLGGNSIFPEDLFGGALDEIRVSNSVRSPAWIQTEFNNQNIPTKNATCSDNGFICLGAEEGGPWNFPWAYGYRKKLTIDPAKVTCGGDISNFPLLVSLVDADLKNRAFGGKVEHANGHDITFRDFDGQTSLDHEVESYDATTGALVAWVRVPSVSATLGTDIYMYFGNPEAACSVENVAGVWDSNYLAVWHLSETPSGANDIKDSTGTHHGTSANMEAGDQSTGQINGSLDFDGVNENIDVPDHADWSFSGGEKRTYEGWFNFSVLPGPGEWDNIIEPENIEYCFEFGESAGSLRLVWFDGFGDHYSPPLSISTGEWHHAVVTVDINVANGSHWYMDGVDLGSFTTPTMTANPSSLNIGGSGSLPLDLFWGALDEVRISDSIRSSCWIQTQYNNQSSPSTFFSIGAMDPDPPTAVQLVAFNATSGDSEVLLEWETGSETNNLGFSLYRAPTVEGPYTRITSALIPGLGSSPEGQQYSYTDIGLTNGVTYYYKLEDIETTGKTREHGPVWATPQATEESGTEEGLGEEETSSSARTTVGRPERNRLNILESRTGELVLELVTEGFYAIPQDDGTVRLEIPEFVLTEEVGSPAVPVRRTWVPVLAGQQVNLVSVSTFDEEIFEGLTPETAGAPSIEVGRGGTVRATRQRRQRVTHRGETYYPEHSAQLLATAFQEDVKKALVEMAPLRWDTTQNRLVIAHRLVVRLSLEGRDLAEQTTSGRRGRRYPRPQAPPESGRVVTRWVTTDAGLHGVDVSRLLRSREGAPINQDALRLSRQGETVPFHIEGSTLYFVSVGGEGNPYGHEAVYELEVGVSGERMAINSAVPGGAPTPYYWELILQEEDLLYQSALVEAPDRWLWKMLFAPARERFTFDMSALAPSPELSQLKVWLQGASDFAADPDHHVQIYVNGTFVGETRWNGKDAKELDLEIGAGILVEGENVIEVENVDDTEATYSMVMLNRIELRYPRRLEAADGYLEGSWSLMGKAEVTGVGAQAHVLEKTPTGFLWLDGTEVTASGIRFQAEAGHDYLVVSPDAVKTPTTRRVSKTNRLKTTTQQADYVLIGPREFLSATSSLLELRRSQGLRAKAVANEDIFSEFGFGEENPQALKDFLAYAYHHWEQAPRYVVLAGDGTYDFKDNLKTGVKNHVPPMMVLTSYLETASDPAYAAVNGEDLLPDLAIGRLPAATVEELQRMVTKIASFETSGYSLGGRAVLVSDDPDGAGDFVADAETLATTALATKDVQKIYLSQLGTPATRSQIQQAFNDGTSLMNYIGHGGIHLWADENIFNNTDVQTLALQNQQPLLLTMNCLNGYFHFPYLNALSEELLKADGKGAVAAFSPSGLSVNAAAHTFHRLLLEELVNGGHGRLGDAVLAAQSAYTDSGALPEMIAIYHLFGDPAMALQ